MSANLRQRLLSAWKFSRSKHKSAGSTRWSRKRLSLEPLETKVLLASHTDHGDEPATATPIAVPSLTAGEIDSPTDNDWFTFAAQSGLSYTISPDLQTVSDLTVALFAPDGVSQISIALNSAVNWTAPASGNYFVRVTPLTNDTGAHARCLTDREHRGFGYLGEWWKDDGDRYAAWFHGLGNRRESRQQRCVRSHDTGVGHNSQRSFERKFHHHRSGR
jgi:hypothetical protein